MKLSIAMLAHNESKVILETLQSTAFADEWVVVDAESSDDTTAIAHDFGATVLTQANIANLNINKNAAIDACSGDWVLYLDADERITPDGAAEIRRAIASNEYDAYFLPRINYILGRANRHGGGYPDWQLRLFRRGRFRFPEKHIHERVAGKGRIGRLKVPLQHKTYYETWLLIRKMNFNARFEAEYAWRQGARPSFGLAWRWLFWKPFSRTIERYFFKLGFLDGFAGVAHTAFDAMNYIVRYLYLVEWKRNPERAP